MKKSKGGSWGLYLLVVGTASLMFLLLHSACIVSSTTTPPLAALSIDTDMMKMMAAATSSRKLEEEEEEVEGEKWEEQKAEDGLEDYRPIDPVPSSKASVKPGPIEHGTPLNPFIPRSPPPSSPPPS